MATEATTESMVQTVLNEAQGVQTALAGLSSSEVDQRIRRGDVNRYEARVNRTYWEIFRDNVLNLFNIVLFTLLMIVLAMGDYGTVFFAGFSVVSNTFLGMLQEMNAKRKLDNLATLTVQRVIVWRDGKRQEIAMRDVVVDDIVEIEPGSKAVVDGVAVACDALEMDESLLTGESDAVFKEIGQEIFSGSYCVAGTGMMRATRVGKHSNINKLSEIAKVYKNVKTPTQKRIDIIVEISVVGMAIFVPMLFISNLLVSEPALPFLQAVRNAVVFITTLVPQGLVLTAVLALTIGAIKISQHQTLVQKVNAVESLANATVLCFDKTGTLTRNELTVTEIITLNGDAHNDITQQLADYLNNLAHLNRTAAAVKEYSDSHTPPSARRKIREIPFTSGRKWGAVEFEDGVLLLGAPERLLGKDHSALETSVRLSREGMRVLAFARMSQAPEQDRIAGLPEPVALVVMSDTIREDIQATLKAFDDEGIRLKVISGDNIETVRSIAAQAGMRDLVAYEGETIDAMTDSQLDSIVEQANIFARIEPETKRRIVSALQKRREYVAMVGDGVNDVPALKQANLAIVMNDGTQISKDIADIVLLNNAMSTLPRAFHEGREITQTIFGTMKLFLVRSLYHIVFFFFILFMSLPFPITPIQISWATFGTINIPATLIAVALVRPKLMKNFRTDVLDYIVVGGGLASVLLMLLYVVVYFGSGRDLELTRSAVTIFVVLFNAYLVCIVQGVDFYQPRTFVTHRRVVLMMVVLIAFTIWTMNLRPTTFEFVSMNYNLHLWVFALIFALFALSMVLMSQILHNRYLIHRFWALLEGDDRTFDAATRQQERS